LEQVAPAPIHESVDPFLGMQQPTKQNPPPQHAAETGHTMKGQTTMTAENGQLALPKTAPVEIQLDQHGVQLRSFDEMARFCKAIVNSGLAPKGFNSPEAVMVAVQHGLELGLAPMQSLQSIAIINGKPCIYGDAALALCTAHPAFLDIEETTEGNTATCVVKRRDRSAVVRTFSEADAKKAGLWGKSGPWQQYPSRMLQMRARSWALRDAFPDALRGLGIREEVSDYQVKQARGREIASSVVLPEPTNAEDFFESAVNADVSQRAALEDVGTGDLFTKAVRV
jgi:hypothetical protein